MNARDRVVEAARFERKLEILATEQPSKCFTPEQRAELIINYGHCRRLRQIAVDRLNTLESPASLEGLMSWHNYRFYVDEIDAREQVALLQKNDNPARLIKLKDGGYMVQIKRTWAED